jgi:hypothetical protein
MDDLTTTSLAEPILVGIFVSFGAEYSHIWEKISIIRITSICQFSANLDLENFDRHTYQLTYVTISTLFSH